MENLTGGFLPSERTTMLYCKLKHHKKYFSTESNNRDKSKLIVKRKLQLELQGLNYRQRLEGPITQSHSPRHFHFQCLVLQSSSENRPARSNKTG